MNKHLESLIDQIVQTIDYDIWKECYNKRTAEDEEQVELARDELRDILEEYVDTIDFFDLLVKSGIEDTEEYESAVISFGKSIVNE